MDTQNDGLEKMVPFKYDHFGIYVRFQGVYPPKIKILNPKKHPLREEFRRLSSEPKNLHDSMTLGSVPQPLILPWFTLFIAFLLGNPTLHQGRCCMPCMPMPWSPEVGTTQLKTKKFKHHLPYINGDENLLIWLVVWTNPFGKILVKMDHSSPNRDENKKYLNHPTPVIYLRVQSIKSSFKKQTIQDQPKKHNMKLSR